MRHNGTPEMMIVMRQDAREDDVATVVSVLEQGGVTILDPGSTTCDVDGTRVGVAGAKGFVGGFPDSQLPDFGEPILRQVYRDTTAEVDAIAATRRRDDGTCGGTSTWTTWRPRAGWRSRRRSRGRRASSSRPPTR